MNKFILAISLYLFIGLSPIVLFSQGDKPKDEQKKETRWNVYKNEIALDFKFLNRDLNLQSIGSNFIYKKRFGEKKFISLNEKKSWRFQIGGYANYPVSTQDTINATRTSYEHRNFNNIDMRINLLAGIEFQRQFDKLQLYYGFDSGVSYVLTVGPHSFRYYTNSFMEEYIRSEDSSFGIPIVGFIGLKYFFHPRFSLSIESALSIGVAWVRSEYLYYNNFNDIDKIELVKTEVAKRTDIRFGTNYLRFINAGFHF